MKNPLFLILLLGATALPIHAASEAKTLCSQGAVGDGKTDDRAAIEAALKAANGNIVDGEGKVYAVRGNIETSGVPIHFRNATLVQIMERLDVSSYIPSAKGKGVISVEPAEALLKMVDGLPYLNASGIGTYAEDPVLSGKDLEKVKAYTGLRTLALQGGEEKPVPVKLEKIKIVRGQYADAGSRTDASGLLVGYASPLSLVDVEITGDGKGHGALIKGCKDVNIHKLNVHDIRWAAYQGDIVLPLSSIKNQFLWNNFPIYEYRSALQRFVRVRVQEQLAGIFMLNCENVVMTDSQVAHMETLIEGKPYAIQADGMTVNRVKNLLIKNCNISFVWEGVDFTGAAGQDFVFENVRTQDCFSFGIKLAHPKQNGKMIDCIVERSGYAGFEIDPGAENMEFTNCQALETGSSGNCDSSNGFQIAGGGKEPPPRQIRFIGCAAINKKYPGKMAHGFFCAPEAGKPEFQNTVTNCVVEGAAQAGIVGFDAK